MSKELTFTNSRLIIPDVEYVMYDELRDDLVVYRSVSNTSYFLISNKDFYIYTLPFQDFKILFDGCYDLGEL